jgi:hypothetical protein
MIRKAPGNGNDYGGRLSWDGAILARRRPQWASPRDSAKFLERQARFNPVSGSSPTAAT